MSNTVVVDRRALLAGATGLLAVPRAGEAQQARKVYRLGILSPVPFRMPRLRRHPTGLLDLWRFRAADLRPHGWAPPQTLQIAGLVRLPDGVSTDAHARRLVAPGPDLGPRASADGCSIY
jgi:hypothetical protein